MNKQIKPTSFHLQWHITEKCNFHCSHCYMEGESKELSLRKMLIILDQYVELIKIWELEKNNRPRKLSLCGGEPLARNDFFDLLKAISEKKGIFTSIIVMSNGSLITKSTAERMKKLGVSAVQISLEGTEKINDEIRGKGSFHKAITGIENAIGAGLPVGVSMTIHKKNYKNFPGLLEFLNTMGIRSVGVSRLVSIGTGKGIRILEPVELRNFYSLVFAKKKGLKDEMRISTHCSDSLWFIEDGKHETHGCSAGYDSFSVLPNGDVVPCRRLPLKLGNVLQKSLFDIWYSSEKLQEIRNKGGISGCTRCGLFGKCFGGARCVAYGYFKNHFAPDPQCWKLFRCLPDKKHFTRRGNRVILNNEYVETFDVSKYFENISNT